jgi:ATP-dependent Clp protease ATP-binding subunit ClpX
MYDLPQRDDIAEVVIDAAAVNGGRRPQLKRTGASDGAGKSARARRAA